MARLTILCFVGTYGLALVCELARFVVRSGSRWYLALGLMAVGLVVHTIYLGNLAWSTGELPITSLRESLLVLAWILAVVGLYLILRSPKSAAIGLFVLPVVIGLSTFGGLAKPAAEMGRWGDWVVFWGSVHGLFLMAGAAATSVAFVAGLMHLAQANRLKNKRPGRFGLKLPSLEQSERINRGAITLAFPLLTVGFFTGIALTLAVHRVGGESLRWNDPKIVSTTILWLLFAALLNARYRPAMRGRRVMLLTIVAFCFLIFTWAGVGVLLPTDHGAKPSAGRLP
jgi:ABC-type transport system involved in cytochrome c biogenesis permease subunit